MSSTIKIQVLLFSARKKCSINQPLYLAYVMCSLQDEDSVGEYFSHDANLQEFQALFKKRSEKIHTTFDNNGDDVT